MDLACPRSILPSVGGKNSSCHKNYFSLFPHLQVNPSRPFSLQKGYRTAHTILRNTGLPGLWRGHFFVSVFGHPVRGLVATPASSSPRLQLFPCCSTMFDSFPPYLFTPHDHSLPPR